jgi:predicted nuclease of predicted toxin-antitoxin system
VLAAANRGSLVLITQDQDFGELAILQQLPVAGIILLELARLPLLAQIDRVAEVLAADPDGFFGKLTVIEPARIRARTLPAATP